MTKVAVGCLAVLVLVVPAFRLALRIGGREIAHRTINLPGTPSTCGRNDLTIHTPCINSDPNGERHY